MMNILRKIESNKNDIKINANILIPIGDKEGG